MLKVYKGFTGLLLWNSILGCGQGLVELLRAMKLGHSILGDVSVSDTYRTLTPVRHVLVKCPIQKTIF